MFINEKRQCFLNGRYTFSEAAGGTVTMMVSYSPETGYEVVLTDNEKYVPSGSISDYFGSNEGDAIPVNSIRT
jgi:hypothetical protein